MLHLHLSDLLTGKPLSGNVSLAIGISAGPFFGYAFTSLRVVLDAQGNTSLDLTDAPDLLDIHAAGYAWQRLAAAQLYSTGYAVSVEMLRSHLQWAANGTLTPTVPFAANTPMVFPFEIEADAAIEERFRAQLVGLHAIVNWTNGANASAELRPSFTYGYPGMDISCQALSCPAPYAAGNRSSTADSSCQPTEPDDCWRALRQSGAFHTKVYNSQPLIGLAIPFGLQVTADFGPT